MTDGTIVALRTFRTRARPNNLWLEIETADGAVGLGETLTSTSAVERHLHDLIAPYLLGRDATPVARHR